MRKSSPNSSFDAQMNHEESQNKIERKNSLTYDEEPSLFEERQHNSGSYAAMNGSNNSNSHQNASRVGLTNLLDPINEFDN